MSVAKHIEDMTAEADLLEEILGRPPVHMGDAARAVPTLSARAARAGLPADAALDRRIANRATAAAIWRRSGGARFEISDSVAASLVLTKAPPGAPRLPLAAFLIHLPRGYMPSRIDGEFDGTMLVVRDGERLFVSNYINRGPDSGVQDMFVPMDIGDKPKVEVEPMGPDHVPGQTEESIISANLRAIRIVKNTCSWLEAFPPTEHHGKRKARSTQGAAVGETAKDGSIYYLRTTVKLDPETRALAKSLAHGRATAGEKRLAMRHVVRGHWKRQPVAGGERKVIFVSPYWRGPDGPAAWGRVYSVASSTR